MKLVMPFKFISEVTSRHALGEGANWVKPVATCVSSIYWNLSMGMLSLLCHDGAGSLWRCFHRSLHIPGSGHAYGRSFSATLLELIVSSLCGVWIPSHLTAGAVLGAFLQVSFSLRTIWETSATSPL